MLALLTMFFASYAHAQFGIKSEQVIVDQAGRKIAVHRPFERIISLYGAHTENLFSLGLSREIIGVSRHEAYPPEALEKQVYSYREDPEKFLGSAPDLVLIRPMIDRGYPKFVKRLEKSGITVVSIQPASVEEMYAYWHILGALSGKQERANEMVVHFKNMTAYFESLTENLTNRKKVYFEAIHKKMKTFSPDAMAVFALETAGGVNIASDATAIRKTNIAAYGKERILSHATEIDIYLAQYGAMNRPNVSMIKNEPGFAAIKAIRNNQIYIIDEKIVSRPTLRLLDGIYEIGSILYPEIYTAEVLSKVTRAAK
jgi:iron complex transport system substrate-binding protein